MNSQIIVGDSEHVIPQAPGYTVTEAGIVYSYRRWNDGLAKRTLRQSTTRGGYKVVEIRVGNVRKTVKVHRLVLLAIVGPPEAGQVARHLDGDPSNNCRSNLCWGTHIENAQDRENHCK